MKIPKGVLAHQARDPARGSSRPQHCDSSTCNCGSSQSLASPAARLWDFPGCTAWLVARAESRFSGGQRRALTSQGRKLCSSGARPVLCCEQPVFSWPCCMNTEMGVYMTRMNKCHLREALVSVSAPSCRYSRMTVPPLHGMKQRRDSAANGPRTAISLRQTRAFPLSILRCLAPGSGRVLRPSRAALHLLTGQLQILGQ